MPPSTMTQALFPGSEERIARSCATRERPSSLLLFFLILVLVLVLAVRQDDAAHGRMRRVLGCLFPLLLRLAPLARTLLHSSNQQFNVVSNIAYMPGRGAWRSLLVACAEVGK